MITSYNWLLFSSSSRSYLNCMTSLQTTRRTLSLTSQSIFCKLQQSCRLQLLMKALAALAWFALYLFLEPFARRPHLETSSHLSMQLGPIAAHSPCMLVQRLVSSGRLQPSPMFGSCASSPQGLFLTVGATIPLCPMQDVLSTWHSSRNISVASWSFSSRQASCNLTSPLAL